MRDSGWIVDGVQVGHHALVEDAGDQNAAGLPAVKDDVAANFHTPEAGANFIAGTTEVRIFS